MHRTLKPKAIALALAMACLSSSFAQSAELISTHNDWKAYKHNTGSELMCFASSAAKEAQPSGASRSDPHVYVTAWPKQGVKAEISVLLGFAIKPETEIKVDIGGASFTMFPDGDRGFITDPADEAKLLEAMRRGIRMTVEATAADGTTSKDVFSLSGVTASLGVISSNCS